LNDWAVIGSIVHEVLLGNDGLKLCTLDLVNR
jgi:hypothetical protein